MKIAIFWLSVFAGGFAFLGWVTDQSTPKTGEPPASMIPWLLAISFAATDILAILAYGLYRLLFT